MSDLSRYDGRYPEPPYPEMPPDLSADLAKAQEAIRQLTEALLAAEEQLDDAREAAQYLYDTVDLRGVKERWPWLETDTVRIDRAGSENAVDDDRKHPTCAVCGGTVPVWRPELGPPPVPKNEEEK